MIPITSVSVSAEVAVIATEGAQVADGFNNKKFVDSPLSSQTFFPQAYMTTLPMASQISQGPAFALTAPRLLITAAELPSFSPPGTLVLRI